MIGVAAVTYLVTSRRMSIEVILGPEDRLEAEVPPPGLVRARRRERRK